MVEAIMNNSQVTVIPQSRRAFSRSLAFYKSRPDKGYSLTDCCSMLLMRERHLSEALTTDRHFEQEGFVALLRTR
jgi:predicted nucleic acid-binding protein